MYVRLMLLTPVAAMMMGSPLASTQEESVPALSLAVDEVAFQERDGRAEASVLVSNAGASAENAMVRLITDEGTSVGGIKPKTFSVAASDVTSVNVSFSLDGDLVDTSGQLIIDDAKAADEPAVVPFMMEKTVPTTAQWLAVLGGLGFAL